MRRGASVTACLALALCVVAPFVRAEPATEGSQADAGADASEVEQSALGELDEAQRPKLSLEVSPDGDIHVGDPIHVVLRADAPAGTRVGVPKQDLGPFEPIERDSRVEPLEGGLERHVFDLTLMRFEAGEATLPALEVRVVTPDQNVGSVHTDPVTVNVLSRVGNEPNAEPRKATAPVSVVEDDYTLAWVAGGLLLAALLAAAGYAFARHRARQPKAVPPPPPPRPPWEVALGKLSELELTRARFVSEDRATEYVDAVSDVVRAYLGDRYGFDGLESTTDEVVENLETQRPAGLRLTHVVTLLSECDLVKFAKAAPDEDLCARLTGDARLLVEESRPHFGPGPAHGGSER